MSITKGGRFRSVDTWTMALFGLALVGLALPELSIPRWAKHISTWITLMIISVATGMHMGKLVMTVRRNGLPEPKDWHLLIYYRLMWGILMVPNLLGAARAERDMAPETSYLAKVTIGAPGQVVELKPRTRRA